MKKPILGMAVAFLIAGIAAPQALAFCNSPGKSISNYNGATGNYVYWHSTAGESYFNVVIVNKFWNGAVDYTGTCMFFSNETLRRGDIALSGNFVDACLPGALCPSGAISAAVAAFKGSALDFLAIAQPETPSGYLAFDFSQDAHAMVAMSRPQVTSSSRAGAIVNLQLAVSAVRPGFYDGTDASVTGYNILSKASTVDPGRLPISYDGVPIATFAAPGGLAATGSAAVDCSNTSLSRWIVVQIMTIAGPTPWVSPATMVDCNPSLADPKQGNRGHKPPDKGR